MFNVLSGRSKTVLYNSLLIIMVSATVVMFNNVNISTFKYISTVILFATPYMASILRTRDFAEVDVLTIVIVETMFISNVVVNTVIWNNFMLFDTLNITIVLFMSVIHVLLYNLAFYSSKATTEFTRLSGSISNSLILHIIPLVIMYSRVYKGTGSYPLLLGLLLLSRVVCIVITNYIGKRNLQ